MFFPSAPCLKAITISKKLKCTSIFIVSTNSKKYNFLYEMLHKCTYTKLNNQHLILKHNIISNSIKYLELSTCIVFKVKFNSKLKLSYI